MSVLPGHSPDPSELPTYYVLGASHHYWTHVAAPTDTKYEIKAKEVIDHVVTEWLKVEDE